MTGWERDIGDGIYEALDVIAREGVPQASGSHGRYAPAIIILVTNGVENQGPSPVEAARLAAARGIRIYTVGLSSPSGPLEVSCQSSDPSGFDGEFGHQPAPPNDLDVETLKQIASLTGAQYFPASGLSGLNDVFRDAQLQTIFVKEQVEVSFAFVLLGATLIMISFLLTLLWNPMF